MSRRIPSLAMLAALCVGCDPLVVRPGGDFALEVLSPQPIVVREQVAPFELSFKVHGCAHFTASLLQPATSDEGEISHKVSCAIQSDGSCLARIPPQWAWIDSWCSVDELNPATNYLGLTVTCTDDGRTVDGSAQVSVIPAWRAAWIGRGEVAELLPVDGQSALVALGQGWATYVDPVLGVANDAPLEVDPQRPHFAAVLGSELYVASGCPGEDCGSETFTDPANPDVQYQFPISWLAAFGVFATELRADEQLAVPDLAQMASDDQGLVLISNCIGPDPVTRVHPDGTVTFALSQQASGRSSNFARLADGSLAFLTRDEAGSQAVFVQVDHPEAAQAFALPGTGEVATLSLSPDASHYALVRDDGVWLGAVAGGSVKLDFAIGESALDLGVAWFADELAVWDEGEAQAFDLSGALRFSYVPDATEPGLEAPDLRGGAGAGDYLALSTYSGVRVLDTQGEVVAGLDPLPCRQLPVAPVIAVDAHRVAVASSAYVYFLDLP